MRSPLTGYPDLPIEIARTQHDAEGAVAVWMVRDRAVFVTRASGKMTVERARLIEDASLEMARLFGRYTSLHDWDDLTDYEVEARLRLVALGVRLRDAGDVHLLVRSRIIVAAVKTAQAILKNLHLQSERDAFDQALAAALRSTRAR